MTERVTFCNNATGSHSCSTKHGWGTYVQYIMLCKMLKKKKCYGIMHITLIHCTLIDWGGTFYTHRTRNNVPTQQWGHNKLLFSWLIKLAIIFFDWSINLLVCPWQFLTVQGDVFKLFVLCHQQSKTPKIYNDIKQIKTENFLHFRSNKCWYFCLEIIVD